MWTGNRPPACRLAAKRTKPASDGPCFSSPRVQLSQLGGMVGKVNVVMAFAIYMLHLRRTEHAAAYKPIHVHVSFEWRAQPETYDSRCMPGAEIGSLTACREYTSLN